MRIPRWLPLLGLIALVALVHLRALETGYTYDDVEAILENPDLRSWSKAPDLFATNYWGSRNIGLYRPLVQLSYLVDGAGFGFDARVSHTIQLLLHLAVVALVFVFLARLGVARGAAWCGAALFGVSPALLEGSVWISGRTDVLAALFMSVALILAAARPGDRDDGDAARPFDRRSILIALAFLLGLFSKEMAVTLPALILLLPGRGHWRRTPMLLVAFAIYVAFRASAVDGVLPTWAGEGEGVVLQDHDALDRVAIGARACARLLAMVLAPVGLAADHRAHPWALPETVADAGAFAILIGAALLCWWAIRRRRRDPVGGFLWSALPISLLPISQLIPIGAVMAERFNYVPAIFLLGGVVHLASRVLRGRLAPLAPMLALTTLGLAIALTLHRIPVYDTRGSFCTDVLRRYPHDYKALNNLGVYHMLERKPPDPVAAEAAFLHALEIHPAYRRGRLNLARARLERERHGDRSVDLDRLFADLEPLLDRGDPDALYLGGKLALRRAEREPAARATHLESALERYLLAAERFRSRGAGQEARIAAALKEAGIAARDLGDVEQAAQLWRDALALQPAFDDAPAMRRFIERHSR